MGKVSIVAVALWLAPTPTSAYTLRTTEAGRPVRWHRSELSFRVSRRLSRAGHQDDVARTVSEAFAGWAGLPCSRFVVEGDVESRGHEQPDGADGTSDLVLVERDWPHDPGFAGVTLVTYDTATGAILDADVFLNGVDYAFEVDPTSPDTYDVGNVLTHELGHLFGLGHSELLDATMYAVSRPGEIAKRSLDADDAAGFAALYEGAPGERGSGAAGLVDTPASGGCGVASGAPSTAGLALLLTVFLGLRRRRRAAAAVTAAMWPGWVSRVQASVGRYEAPEELAARVDLVARGVVVKASPSNACAPPPPRGGHGGT